jgi:hypothetical protein
MKLNPLSFSSPAPSAPSLSMTGASTELGLIRQGLVAEYRFNEGSGQILYDYSGNNNHGMLGSTTGSDTNDPTWGSTGATFTTDDYIRVGAVTSGGATQNMYMCCIVFYSASAISKSTTGQALFNMSDCPGTERSWVGIGNTTTGLNDEIISVIYPSGSHGTGWCDGSGTLAGGWHILIFVWNGVTYDIWVDAVKKTTTAGSSGHAALAPLSDIYIGAREGAGATGVFFTGSIAYLSVYNRALTQSEITQNYTYLKGYLLRERGISLA